MLTGAQLMVVLIVLIAVVGSVIKRKDRHGPRFGPAGDDADAARLRDEVRRLQERVQVLERAITDNHSSVSLDREIERLRDR